MRAYLLFGAATFFAGWIVQILSFYPVGVTWSAPQWLLLVVLALGGLGETFLAQTLGLLWGLCLDAYGMSLFGSQGWLLAVCGYAVGQFSRQLNVSKWVTQLVLVLAGTGFFLFGLYELEIIFRWPEGVRGPGVLQMLIQLLWNLLAAPPVFWVVRRWREAWPWLGERNVFHE